MTRTQIVNIANERLKTPASGGRPTCPLWTMGRNIPMSKETLASLERMASSVGKISPMQVAAFLIEDAVKGWPR